MSDDFVEYWLPTSVLRVKGTVTRRAGGRGAARAAASVAAELTLDTVADKDVPRGGAHPVLCVARIRHGLFTDTNVRFDLTDDRRLVAAGAEPAGQPATIALGATGTSAGVRVAREYDSFAPADAAALRAAIEKDAKSDGGHLEAAFLAEMPQAALARRHFHDVAARLLGQLQEALAAVEKAGAVEDRHRRALARVLSCQKALNAARSEVARLDALFEAWRADRTDTSVERVELTVPIADIIATRPGEEGWGFKSPRVVDLLQRLGIWAVVEEMELRLPSKAFDESVITVHEGRRIAAGVILRQPRLVSLSVYQYCGSGGAAPWPGDPAELPFPLEAGFGLVERRTCYIVDRDSRHEFVAFRRSLWGRRSVDLNLSAIGALQSYTARSHAGDAGASPPATARGNAHGKHDKRPSSHQSPLDLQIAELRRRMELERRLSGADASDLDA